MDVSYFQVVTKATYTGVTFVHFMPETGKDHESIKTLVSQFACIFNELPSYEMYIYDSISAHDAVEAAKAINNIRGDRTTAMVIDQVKEDLLSERIELFNKGKLTLGNIFVFWWKRKEWY